MFDETQTRRDNALDLLDELDGRHDLLLTELEQLNQRIDSVLSEYSKSRQAAALASGVGVERPADSTLSQAIEKIQLPNGVEES